MFYTFDFETRNNEKNIIEGTSVWLYDICDPCDNYSHINGYNITDFFNDVKKLSPCVMYSHNLKFDGAFIIDYLLKNGYKHTTEKTLIPFYFSTLITSDGLFYNIKICFESGNKKRKKICEFRDSSKKIQGSVERIAISYNLPVKKGKIDYTLYRDNNYVATEEEVSYINNDTEIIARVLYDQYMNDMDKMTTAADTFNLYKKSINLFYDIFFFFFLLNIDNFIRKSYRGGVVLLNENYIEKTINNKVYVYDINSMYPTQMVYKILPYGIPKYFIGKYKQSENYPLYISHIEVCCKLKDGFPPTLQLKTNRYGKLEYIKDTEGTLIELYLTNIDLSLLLQYYEIYEIKYIDGYKFHASKNLFKQFILPLYEKKCITKGSEKERYKLLLNSLYGKFASNPKHQQKIPYLENDIVKYKNGEITYDNPIYTAISSYITAYSREMLYTAILNNFDSFVYCDTDSIHLTKEAKNIDIDDKKLGAFKLEKIYIKSKYLAQKSYIGLKENNSMDIKLSGCPDNLKQNINFENFNFNETFSGKLLPKTVKGGVVLVPYDFTIKPR